MARHPSAVIVLLIGLALDAGCVRVEQSAVVESPPVIGPEAVLLRTPDSFGHNSFEISVAFSPDGRTVAAGRMEPSGTKVSLCDVSTRRERATIDGPIAESCSVAFSPDGRALAVGLDRAIRLYDPGTGEEKRSLVAEDAYGSTGLAFSPDGRLASATLLGNVVLWDIAAGGKPASFEAHTRSLRGVAISPDGRWMASASDGPIMCHSYGPFGLPPGIFGVSSVGCGPDHGVVRLFDVATGHEAASLKHEGTANSVSFSADGKWLASGGGGAAKLWDLATGEARTIIRAEAGLDVYCVSYSPDGRSLAVGLGSREFGGSFGEVRLWDVPRDRFRAVLKGDMGKVRSLAFAPDGKTLVTGSRMAITLWDASPERTQAVEEAGPRPAS